MIRIAKELLKIARELSYTPQQVKKVVQEECSRIKERSTIQGERAFARVVGVLGNRVKKVLQRRFGKNNVKGFDHAESWVGFDAIYIIEITLGNYQYEVILSADSDYYMYAFTKIEKFEYKKIKDKEEIEFSDQEEESKEKEAKEFVKKQLDLLLNKYDMKCYWAGYFYQNNSYKYIIVGVETVKNTSGILLKTKLISNYGRIGTSGKINFKEYDENKSVREFSTHSKGHKAFSNYKNEKIRKGYKTVQQKNDVSFDYTY